MENNIFIFLAVFAGFFNFNVAQAQDSVLTPIPLTSAYIPAGFDNINRIQITVEAILPTRCYRAGPHQVKIEGNTITVTQAADVFKTGCIDIVTQFSNTIELGILPVGIYQIVDGTSGKILGTLPVNVAPPKPEGTFPDDFLYAPIADASVVRMGGQNFIVLSGKFTDNCTHFASIPAKVYGHVIEVLPITTRTRQGCTHGIYPFQKNRVVSIPDGHYLLYVRSLSGNAINKMVDVFDIK